MTVSLACQPAREHELAPDPMAAVPSAGTSRRLRALAFMGHGAQALASRLAAGEHAIRHLQAGQPAEVPAVFAAAVAALYDRLWDVRGPSARSARAARRRGFAPPLAWDDNPGDPHYIDDPAAVAAEWKPRRLSPAERAEDVEELLAAGCTLNQVAWRLGVTRDAVDQLRRRAAAARHSLIIRELLERPELREMCLQALTATPGRDPGAERRTAAPGAVA